MSRSVLLKVVLVTALVGLALIGRDVGAFNTWITPGLVAFGIVNVVFSPRGTSGIRAVASAGALAALFWPPIQTLVVLLAWLVWPPAFLVAWALGREVDDSPDVEQPERSAAATRARDDRGDHRSRGDCIAGVSPDRRSQPPADGRSLHWYSLRSSPSLSSSGCLRAQPSGWRARR
jgi:hypothetical protein